jgi:hypothetical protein
MFTTMAVVLCIGLGLRWVNLQTPAPDEFIQADDQTSGGIDERSEFVEIWLPKALYDLANDEPGALSAGSGAELRSRSKGCRSAPVWIAFRVRHYPRHGRPTDIRHLSYPWDASGPDFQQYLDLLATAAGKPPRYPTVDFSGAKVGIIPDRLMGRNPRDVLDELIPETPAPPAK